MAKGEIERRGWEEDAKGTRASTLVPVCREKVVHDSTGDEVRRAGNRLRVYVVESHRGNRTEL